jgi:Spy/CpxP family protein refolding chaperone
MTKVLLVIGFLVALGAGVIIGMELRQPASATANVPAPAATRGATGAGGPGGMLTARLGLTPEQQEQMKRIWSETAHRGGREADERRRQFRKERDDAIAALVRPEDRPKYDAAVQHYADRQAAMEREWRSSFQAAVEKTKAILAPDQAKRYEEFLKEREADRVARNSTTNGSGSGNGGGNAERDNNNRRPPGTRATTRPAVSEK